MLRSLLRDLSQRDGGVIVFHEQLYLPFMGGSDLRFNHKNYLLEKADTMFNLENNNFSIYQKQIEKRLIARGNHQPSNLATMINDAYSEMHGQAIDGHKKSNVIPSFWSLINRKKTILSDVVRNNIYITKKKTYEIKPARYPVLDIEGRCYGLNPVGHTEQFLLTYERKMNSFLEARLNRIKIQKDDPTSNQKIKLSGCREQMTCSHTIDSFILAERYRFPPVCIGIDLKEEADSISILHQPRILTENYNHPVVFSDGNICFNGGSRWGRLEIRFGHDYRKDEGAYKIALCLNEAKKVLTHHFGSVRKVKELNQENFKNEYLR